MSEINNYIYKLESYFEFDDILDTHIVYFFNNKLVVNSTSVGYNKISKVTKCKNGLRISMIDKTVIDIPCEQTIKKQIFLLFKNLSECTEIIDPAAITGSVVMEFGDLYFVVYLRNSSYEEFRKILLKRLAFYFYPRFKENNIDLEHYDDFKFYVRDDKILIPIENSSDLGSALFHFNYRLKVYIRYKKRKNK
ncbi:hypothetical protein NGRA_0562 [Nosema granulosis]|uniref:Uncharacterized protein n=1 Tax=Nosema granulosis TaxID=83296 RepID=A0A9P6H3C3_9MICR|nr:hypothetical protein NGRA_0562 [Nosema granulosis]